SAASRAAAGVGRSSLSSAARKEAAPWPAPQDFSPALRPADVRRSPRSQPPATTRRAPALRTSGALLDLEKPRRRLAASIRLSRPWGAPASSERQGLWPWPPPC